MAPALHPGFAPLIGIAVRATADLLADVSPPAAIQEFRQAIARRLGADAAGLASGHSLAAGFQLVAEEMSAPIATEFRRVFEEQNLGIPLDEALKDMTERMPNLDLKFFATAVDPAAADGRRLGRNPRQNRPADSRAVPNLGSSASADRRRPTERHRAVGLATRACSSRSTR